MATVVNKKAAAKKLRIRFIMDPPLSWLLLDKGIVLPACYDPHLMSDATSDPVSLTIKKLIEYLTACENTKDVLSGRGKRGGPLRSATPVEALLGFALFALALGDFAFAFCLAFALGRILGRHLFRIAFAFLLGLGFLRVTFSFIFGRYFLVFAFALVISLLLIGGRLLFVTHLFSRNSRGSHEHRSNQHNKKTFHQILLMDRPFLVRK